MSAARIGLLGPCLDDTVVLREGLELLLETLSVDQVLYLGVDDAAARVVKQWGEEIMMGPADEATFLDRACALAQSGTADEIEELLAADRKVGRLSNVRTLPPAPARAIEMMADRIVVVVHDKAVLDEEDIANANLIVYGKSDEVLLKKFGHRYFFTPGPLTGRKLALLELDDDGAVSISVVHATGEVDFREVLQGPKTKMQVTS